MILVSIIAQYPTSIATLVARLRPTRPVESFCELRLRLKTHDSWLCHTLPSLSTHSAGWAIPGLVNKSPQLPVDRMTKIRATRKKASLVYLHRTMHTLLASITVRRTPCLQTLLSQSRSSASHTWQPKAFPAVSERGKKGLW